MADDKLRIPANDTQNLAESHRREGRSQTMLEGKTHSEVGGEAQRSDHLSGADFVGARQPGSLTPENRIYIIRPSGA